MVAKAVSEAIFRRIWCSEASNKVGPAGSLRDASRRDLNCCWHSETWMPASLFSTNRSSYGPAMDQQLNLDRTSFERFLATASLLQQLQKRAISLNSHAEDMAPQLAELVNTQQAIQAGALSVDEALLRITALALARLGSVVGVQPSRLPETSWSHSE